MLRLNLYRIRSRQSRNRRRRCSLSRLVTLAGPNPTSVFPSFWTPTPLTGGPNKTNVGYWPARNLFRYLPYRAIFVQWGGQVYRMAVQKQRKPHTATAMGSGQFAESLYGVAAFVNHARIVDWSRSSKYPEWIRMHRTEIDCYNAYKYREGTVGGTHVLLWRAGEELSLSVRGNKHISENHFQIQ